MIGRLAVSFAVAGITGCGGAASLVLKDPLVDKCSSAGLNGCPELADGVVAYVDGDRGEAKAKIHQAVTKNEPAQVREFASTIRAMAKLPGTSSFGAQLVEIADLLAPEEKRAVTSVKRTHDLDGEPATEGEIAGSSAPSTDAAASRERRPADEPPRAVFRQRISTADSDPEQLMSGAVVPGRSAFAVPCAVGVGGASACARATRGPLVITDLDFGSKCDNDVLAYTIGDEDGGSTPHWSVAGMSRGGIHGARVVLRPGEALVVGVQAASDTKLMRDARCTVAWAGFRPYSDEIR